MQRWCSNAKWLRAGLQGCMLVGALTLTGCSRVPPSVNPLADAPVREPPPGANDPYPNLGTVPARPTRPDVAALQAVQTGLVADRATAGQVGYVTTTGTPGAVPHLQLDGGPVVADAPPAPPALPGVRSAAWPAPRQAPEVPVASVAPIRLFAAGQGSTLSPQDMEKLHQFVQNLGQKKLQVTGLGEGAQARVDAIVAELRQYGVPADRIHTSVQTGGRGALVSMVP